MDSLLFVLFMIGYFVLLKFILPKFGISTWLSNACDVPVERNKDNNKEKESVESKQNII